MFKKQGECNHEPYIEEGYIGCPICGEYFGND